MKVYSELDLLLKLVLNIVGGENEHAKYFLDLALKELLVQILQWNAPEENSLT